MTLPGTLIAQQVIRRRGKSVRINRIYSEKRAGGHYSHKIYGRFSEDYAQNLIRKITELGGRNARLAYSFSHYGDGRILTGVRFEAPLYQV